MVDKPEVRVSFRNGKYRIRRTRHNAVHAHDNGQRTLHMPLLQGVSKCVGGLQVPSPWGIRGTSVRILATATAAEHVTSSGGSAVESELSTT